MRFRSFKQRAEHPCECSKEDRMLGTTKLFFNSSALQHLHAVYKRIRSWIKARNVPYVKIKLINSPYNFWQRNVTIRLVKVKRSGAIYQDVQTILEKMKL